MREMSSSARTFVLGVVGLGAVLLLGALPSPANLRQEWLFFVILAVCAAAAQAFPVLAPRNQSYSVTPVFLFAGVFLLSPPALGLLTVVAFVPEWIKARKVWYIQLFNIANFLIDLFAARTLYEWLAGGQAHALNSTPDLGAALLAAGLFTLLNHLLAAIALHLVRGHSWHDTRLFELEYFLTDATLACIGVIVVILWQISPVLAGLAAAPLFHIYRGLSNLNLQEEARTDTKTGLYNARHLTRVLQEELRRAARFERPLAVIMADMDLLRNINNSYGHLAGDVVLQGVAGIIKRSLREYDLAARFGGEEFAVVLPETDSEQALAVAERIRQQVEAARFLVSTSDRPIQATLSLGLAVFPQDGWDPSEVIHQADLAVYYAKLLGRNRAWVSSAESRSLGPVMAGRKEMEGGSPAAVIPALRAYRQMNALGTQGADGADRDHAGTGDPADCQEPPARGAEAARDPDEGAPPAESRAGKRERAGDPSWEVSLFIGAVAVAALVPWAMVRPWEAQLDWLGLAALAVLTALAQSMGIEIYGHGRISSSGIILLAGAFLFGEPAGLLLAPVIPVTVWLRSRGYLHRALFDVGDTTLSAVAAALLYRWAVGWLPNPEPALLAIPATLAALAYYVVNVGLISVAIALTERRSVPEVWSEKFRWLFAHYLVFGVLALLMSLAYRAIGLYGLLAFFMPPVMLRQVMRQYTDHTQSNVAEMRRVNEELVMAHDEVVSTLQQLRATYDATLVALSAALDSRDSDTEGHSQRVVEYTAGIARELGLVEEEPSSLLNGALLHDVGKIGVPDAILSKRGPLTAAEWEVMRSHPEQGYRMLQHIGFLRAALPVVKHHHEHYDGSGYPDGLRDEEIPLAARIFAVADAFDAMTSDRPYRQGRSVQEARNEIARCAGSQFDPQVVAAFLRISPEELARTSGRALPAADDTLEPAIPGRQNGRGRPGAARLA